MISAPCLFLFDVGLLDLLSQASQVSLDLLSLLRISFHAMISTLRFTRCEVPLSWLAQKVELLVILVEYLCKLAQDMVFSRDCFTIGATIWQVLIIEPEELLFENVQLVLYILDVSTEGSFNIDGLSPTHPWHSLLDGLADLCSEFERCHAMFNLNICCVQIGAEDDFGTWR